MAFRSPNQRGENEEFVAFLIALGGELFVGLAGMIGMFILLGHFEIYGPPQVAYGVPSGFVVGVYAGRRLFRWRLPPAE
jgi:hypothetical protein